jgi:hypothetical protein
VPRGCRPPRTASGSPSPGRALPCLIQRDMDVPINESRVNYEQFQQSIGTYCKKMAHQQHIVSLTVSLMVTGNKSSSRHTCKCQSY